MNILMVCLSYIFKFLKDIRMYPYVTRMLLVCLRMLRLCTYPYVTRVLLVCIRKLSSDLVSV